MPDPRDAEDTLQDVFYELVEANRLLLPHVSGRRCRLPDGSERYLVDATLLTHRTRKLGGQLLDPLKTTIVQNQWCTTTWVVRPWPPV